MGALELGRMAAYLHRSYADSLSEFGSVRHLPRSGAWVLERPIPGTDYRDAMGCYPLLCCKDWRQLDRDLSLLRDQLVSVSAIADPFGDYRLDDLRQSFVDLVSPFKEHFVTDLHRPAASFVAAGHQRNAQQALERLCVEVCEQPSSLIEEWTALYTQLVARHRITGIPAFSKAVFVRQLQVPGMVALRATRGDTTVAMSLWLIQDDVAYYHLSAANDLGYELRAGFALMWLAIECLGARGLRWLGLGAGAGISAAGDDGLSRFKRGWSTETRTAYLCGRILDRRVYGALTRAHDAEQSSYFPAYRTGEF